MRVPLLLALTIAEWCNLSNQWLYMSAYFDRNKDDYIDRLLRVSTHGAWEEWVEFCLHGVVSEAHDTMKRCDDLISLNRDFHERASRVGGSVRLSGIVDGLFVAPVTTVTRVAQSCNVTYPTARADLRKLETAGVLAELKDAPTISYYAPRIFEIVYAD